MSSLIISSLRQTSFGHYKLLELELLV